MSYRNIVLNEQGEAADNSAFGSYGGFVVAHIECGPSNRQITVDGYVDGAKVVSATAADNSAPGVISSPSQSFTMPVPPGSNWKVVAKPAKGVQVWWAARF